MAQILLNFDRNHPKLFGTGEKLPKDSGKNISIKYWSKMWYFWSKNMKGKIEKVEILHRGQSHPARRKTSRQLFYQLPLHGANISQIFPLTHQHSCIHNCLLRFWIVPNVLEQASGILLTFEENRYSSIHNL